MKQILINTEPFEKRVAVITRGVLDEFHIERADQPRLAANIYKGVIEAVVPGIGAVFVDMGTGKNGFLYIYDVEENSLHGLIDEDIDVEGRQARRDRPIREHLKKGQQILVQVVKEPIGTKGPLLTTDISLPGKFLVLTPFSSTIGVSKRIEDRNQRSKIKDVLEKLDLAKGMGCIARTESASSNPRQLILEAKYLRNLWLKIKRRADKQKAPALIYEEYDLPLRIIRDYRGEDIQKILVDSKEEYRKISRFANSISPRLRKKIFFYRSRTPLYEKFGVDKLIEGIFRRKVFLRNGGHIILEQTESLMAIDVNTGKFTGKTNPEETAFKTNMEAAEEVARQIMLRDIGGIIIIDFIDMLEKSHRKRVYDTLEGAFKNDKAKINILTISPIGVVEMTRQRVRKSLESVSFRQCPYCNGMGMVKTEATIAIDAFRTLQRHLGEKKAREISLIAHPDVILQIETSFGNLLRILERKFRKKIILKRDSRIHVEEVHFE